MISFIQGSNFRKINHNQNEYKIHNGKKLYLLDPAFDFNIFELIPRTFTISTSNKSYRFNIKLLKNCSPIIRELLKKDPKIRNFEIRISDPTNVLGKLEDLFLGKFVFFKEYELPYIQRLTDLLQITGCPKYMKYNDEEKQNNNEKQELFLFNGVVMNPNYDYFLTNKVPKSFTIITNKNEYKCNIYGVYSSNLIRDLLKNQPTLKQYKYDFDDEFDEFQQICDIFNFNSITITPDNMDIIKEISEHFKIDPILPAINKFIQKQDKVSQTIEDDQNSVELIDQLFDWLYNIKQLTVETVYSSIIESTWSKTDDEVRELAAFLLQVINNDISLHNELIELIIMLNDKLKILTPFLVDKLMRSFGYTILNCSFVYKLYKKEIIQKEKLKEKLTKRIKDINSKSFYYIISWFLPELIEFNLFKESKIQNKNDNVFNYIGSFLPDKIDLYKKMRDSDTPDDLITKTIREDDIDSFQSYITKNCHIKDISKCFIPYNIFDDFIENDDVTYLNYAAACGSIKCFKYLLLNYEEDMDKTTFDYALLGGNSEIIKIVDQRTNVTSNKISKKTKSFSFSKPGIKTLGISTLIEKHRNDLFDWVFEQKFNKSNLNNNLVTDLVFCAIRNGNIHALIEFIDNGFNLHSNTNKNNVINRAAENGFYKLLEIIVKIVYKKPDDIDMDRSNFSEFVSFGNISILKLFMKTFIPKNKEIIETIAQAILADQINIIDYFFDEKDIYCLDFNSSSIYSLIATSLKQESSESLEYLIEKFKKFYPDEFNNVKWSTYLLELAAQYKNEKGFHIILEYILKLEKNNDFSKCFFNAVLSDSLEICKYLIDNKLFTNYDLFLNNSSTISQANKEIMSLIINCCDSQLKERLLQMLLYPAIDNHNFELVEYLLTENISIDDSLITAVSRNDYEIVELILKYKNDPDFINQGSNEGTPLIIASKNRNILIVKKLLSLPSINISLCDRNDETALMRAADNNNFEIINELLSYYNDKIFDQRYQLDYMLNKLSYDACNNNFSKEKCEKIIKVFEKLLSYDKFKTIFDEHNYKILINICKNKHFADLIKTLLKIDCINFNIHSASNGDTPLIAAIGKKNVEIAELLINDPRTNINLKNFDKQSALTVAIQNNLETVIELLLNNEKLDPKESLLEYAFIISNSTISQILLSKKLVNVNCKIYENQKNTFGYKSINHKYFKTALLHAVSSDNMGKIELIINHPEFDKEKSLLKDAIELSITSKKNNILHRLIGLLSIKEINEFNHNNKSITSLLIENENDSFLEELIQNNEFIISDKDIKNNLFSLFTIRKRSYQLMKLLIDYDKKHNNSIEYKKYSFFNIFRETYNGMNSRELLEQYEKITDLIYTSSNNDTSFFNLANTNLIYPFENAINIGSKELATALINSNKVDFNELIYKKSDPCKFTSYFHLAAASANSNILKLLIDKKILNMFNINIRDTDRNTPLFYACKNLRVENVKLLFRVEGIDYKSMNKNHENALQVVQKILNSNKKIKNKSKFEEIQLSKISKEFFLKQLIATIREANGDWYDDDNDNQNDNDDISDDDEDDEDDDIPVSENQPNEGDDKTGKDDTATKKPSFTFKFPSIPFSSSNNSTSLQTNSNKWGNPSEEKTKQFSKDNDTTIKKDTAVQIPKFSFNFPRDPSSSSSNNSSSFKPISFNFNGISFDITNNTSEREPKQFSKDNENNDTTMKKDNVNQIPKFTFNFSHNSSSSNNNNTSLQTDSNKWGNPSEENPKQFSKDNENNDTTMKKDNVNQIPKFTFNFSHNSLSSNNNNTSLQTDSNKWGNPSEENPKQLSKDNENNDTTMKKDNVNQIPKFTFNFSHNSLSSNNNNTSLQTDSNKWGNPSEENPKQFSKDNENNDTTMKKDTDAQIPKFTFKFSPPSNNSSSTNPISFNFKGFSF